MVVLSALTGLALAPCAIAAEAGEESNVTARAVVEWLTPSAIVAVTAGMRTSDYRSQPHSCTAQSSNDGTCTVEDTHRSTPKNIGNILCLHARITRVEFEPSCTALLTDGQFSGCQRNAFHNAGRQLCNTSTADQNPVMPACNYRTEKTGEVEWRWTIAERDGVYVIGCSQQGYRGYSEAPEAQDSVATGCLRYGRLLAVAVGDVPLRPCRPQEVEVTIPAEVGF